jgi:hypothetical protein
LKVQVAEDSRLVVGVAPQQDAKAMIEKEMNSGVDGEGGWVEDSRVDRMLQPDCRA